MILNMGEYKIETDNLQFIVSSKNINRKNNLKSSDNKSDTSWKIIAYCTTFESALKFIPQKVLRDNDDIKVIKDKLDQIYVNIKELNAAALASAQTNSAEDVSLTKEEYEILLY